MNTNRFTMSMLSLAAIVAVSTSTVRAEDVTNVDCSKQIKAVKVAVAKEDSNVLKIVADEVSASPACACEIVKVAITESKSVKDKAMVVQIVKAAAEAAPEQVGNIISCASDTAPTAVAEIANAFASEKEGSGKGVVSSGKEAAGKEPVSGKEVSGKGPVVTEETDFSDDFGLMRPGVGGLYFSNPGGGNNGTLGKDPGTPDDTTTDDKTPRPNRPPGHVSPTTTTTEESAK